jgi:hypothetical protein
MSTKGRVLVVGIVLADVANRRQHCTEPRQQPEVDG